MHNRANIKQQTTSFRKSQNPEHAEDRHKVLHDVYATWAAIMDLMELLHQLFLHILDIFKIYIKFALITLVIYFLAEWYILRYGAELEAELDAHLVEGAELREESPERPESNSTLSKVFRFVVNFFIL